MKLFSKTANLITSLSVAFGTALVPVPVSAAQALFSVSPSGGTYIVGSTLSVNIFEDSGSNDVDSARADLTYDPAALELTGVTNTGSPFTTCLSQARGGNGSLTTGDCTLLGGKKQGVQMLGQASFKVLGSAGMTTIAFASSSQLVSNGVDLSWTAANGTYAMSAPAVKSVTTAKKTTTVAKAVEETAPVTATPTPVETTEPEKVTTETTIADENGDSKDDDAKTTSSSTWLRLLLLGIAAVGFGYAASRRNQDPKKVVPADTKKAAKPEAKPVAAAKKSKKAAPKKKSTPKKTKKTVKKSKK